MAAFDHVQKLAFGAVTRVFGDEGVYDGDAILGLFREPTEKEREIFDSYSPRACIFEYWVTDWVGLKGTVDAGGLVTVTVNGLEYDVRQVTAKYDGKHMFAHLEKV